MKFVGLTSLLLLIFVICKVLGKDSTPAEIGNLDEYVVNGRTKRAAFRGMMMGMGRMRGWGRFVCPPNYPCYSDYDCYEGCMCVDYPWNKCITYGGTP